MKPVFSPILGQIGAVTAFSSVILSLPFLLGYGACHDTPCPAIPFSYGLFVVLFLGSPIVGIVGAGVLEKHPNGGSLALLVAGSLPLIAGFLFPLDPGGLQVDLSGLLFFLWWCPVLILAGVLGHFESSRSAS